MSLLFNSKNIIRLDSVNSTNTFALNLLKREDLANGTMIICQQQTAGKGQGDAKWESEAGKNLTFSIVLYPDFLKAENQLQLNKSIALGIMDFVKSRFKYHDVQIKWPNDIYIGKEKVAGTLIVNSISGNRFEYTLIGIGVNINQIVFLSDAPNPVSFRMLSGKDYDLEKELEDLSNSIFRRYNQLLSDELLNINDDYLDSLYQINSWNKYSYQGKIIDAMITGISEYGRLELTMKAGSEEQRIDVDVKELVYL